jgi:rubrerythrin
MMNLKPKLQYDLRGETKAIKDYGQRIKQAKGTPIAKTLEEIQEDEKDHHKKLISALAGLKATTPK